MSQLPEDPIARFREWYQDACEHKGIKEAGAVNLATATRDGKPSCRMVLLKGYDENGFVFYTNLKSRKGRELEENPMASLCFYWEPMMRQIRVEGRVMAVSEEEADSYFATRPLKSRIGAWASKQSQPLESQAMLLKNIALQTARFASGKVPRPPFWSGFLLVPHSMEFWQNGDFRLPERISYSYTEAGGWQKQLLYP